MKKHYYLILALVLAISANIKAHAADTIGVFVEPFLTYEVGDATVNFPSPFGTSDSTANGFGLGGRVGFHVLNTFFVGADARYSMLNYENKGTHIDTDASAYNFAIIAGAQLPTPFGIRVWAGYIVGGQMDPDSDRGIDVKFKDADGFRLGAGIKLVMVSLNLEYQKMSYDKTEVQNSGAFNGTTSSTTQDNDSVIFSVSFPINI